MTSITDLISVAINNLEEIRQRLAAQPSGPDAVKLASVLGQSDSLKQTYADVAHAGLLPPAPLDLSAPPGASPQSSASPSPQPGSGIRRRSTRRGGQGHHAGIVLEYAGQYLCVKVESNWIFPRCACTEASGAVSSAAIALAATELGVTVDHVDAIVAGGKSHYVLARLTAEPTIKLGGKYAEYKWLEPHYLRATSTTDDMIRTLSGLSTCTGRLTPQSSPKKQISPRQLSPRQASAALIQQINPASNYSAHDADQTSPSLSPLSIPFVPGRVVSSPRASPRTRTLVPRTANPRDNSWRVPPLDFTPSIKVEELTRVLIIVTFGKAILCIDDGGKLKLPHAMASVAVICRAHNRLAWTESVLREHAGIEKVTGVPRMISAEGITAVVVQFDDQPTIDNAPTHAWHSLEEMAARGCDVAAKLSWTDGVLTCDAVSE